jgi:hypothetical protein
LCTIADPSANCGTMRRAAFTADGTFTDLSIGVTWTGRDRQLTDPRAGKLIALPDRLGVTRQ